jgi:ubiquinone/menaquinone biosynthesis C-methylase UbiE
MTRLSDKLMMRMDYQSRKYVLLNSPLGVEQDLRRVRTFLQPRAPDRMLEIGCGRGFLTRRVQAFAPATTGVDLNPAAIAGSVTTGLRAMNPERLEFPDAHFDKLYSFHVIERIPNLAKAFAEMDRVLKPGGMILLAYAAEPIRGLYAVLSTIARFGNPFRARAIQLHKLSPPTLRRYLARTSLVEVWSTLHWLYTPQFVSVLRKRVVVSARAPVTPSTAEAATLT